MRKQVETAVNDKVGAFIGNLRGDGVIWIAVFALIVISLLAVYSSTLTFAYKVNGKDTLSYFLKHFFITMLGVVAMYQIHKIRYIHFERYATPGLYLSLILLAVTLVAGTNLNSASRWLTIPVINMSFQTSDLAKLCLIVYIASYLKRHKEHLHELKQGFLYVMIAVSAICFLIFLANFSSAAVTAVTSLIILYIGGVKPRFIFTTIGICLILGFTSYIVGGIFPNIGRLGTVKSRIDNFFIEEEDSYQVEQAKIAIAKGGIIGVGPGKSTQRNYLPHPYSDFIYAIIIEEYGILGGVLVLLCYLVILWRVMKVVHQSNRAFGSYLALGLTVYMVFQAFINMGVAVNLLPVTGLTLPLVSMGGTSVIFMSIAFGMILSVSRYVLEESKTQTPSVNPKLEPNGN